MSLKQTVTQKNSLIIVHGYKGKDVFKKQSHVEKEVEMVKNVKILQEGLKWLKTVNMDLENI